MCLNPWRKSNSVDLGRRPIASRSNLILNCDVRYEWMDRIELVWLSLCSLVFFYILNQKVFRWRWISRCILRLKNSQRFRQDCCSVAAPSFDCGAGKQHCYCRGCNIGVNWQRREKILPEGMLSSLWQRVHSCSHNSQQAESVGLCSTCMCVQRNASLVIVVLSWPHLHGRFRIRKRRKESGEFTLYNFRKPRVFSGLMYFS